jgi:peptide-methionine (S)-S-oxide reductase
MSRPRTLLAALCTAVLLGCTGSEADSKAPPEPTPPRAHAAPSTEPEPATSMPTPTSEATAAREVATLGNGCFWCSEAVIERLDGVLDVTSGYAGGTVDSPTYDQVCTGATGHAEVVQITFDPKRLTYATLLEWFFKSHDPTTRNRQGPDEGTQYRSVIFYHSEAQKAAAHAAISKAQPSFRAPITTEVAPLVRFWPAEDYHQGYFDKHATQPYCRAQILPKLQKLGLDPRPK